MGKLMRSYKIFILFLLMNVSVFAGKRNDKTPPGQLKKAEETVVALENDGSEDYGITTLTIERFSKSFDVDLVLQNGGGNALIIVEQDGKNFKISDDGQKIIIKFTGNKGKSMAVEVNGEVKISVINKVADTLYYGYSGGELELLRFAIKNGGGSPSFVKGNGATDIITINFPKNIEIKTYEEYKNDGIIEDLIDGSNAYKFTKGGAGSYVKEPVIYVTVPEIGTDGKKIIKLKIKTTTKGEDSEDIVTEEIHNLSGKTGDVEINYDSFGEEANFREGINMVEITPINENGEKGTPKELKFVVDTRVNDSYLEGGIIGELDDNGKVVIDLANLKELSGVKEYSYEFIVGEKDKSGSKGSINNYSFSTPTVGSTDEVVTIDISGLKEGSKGRLLFTVYDKLGHKKTFEKTYFIPAKPSGIIAKVSGEIKQRNSRIKILTEGSGDKFGVDSNIDMSSE